MASGNHGLPPIKEQPLPGYSAVPTTGRKTPGKTIHGVTLETGCDYSSITKKKKKIIRLSKP